MFIKPMQMFSKPPAILLLGLNGRQLRKDLNRRGSDFLLGLPQGGGDDRRIVGLAFPTWET
jgi:hypothetical protein